MVERSTVHLLSQLTEHADYQTAILFTYGADLAFFEEGVLHPLWENGCRSCVVFMDARRYADTLTDLRGSATWVGRRYILIPVDMGVMRSFHPKMVLLLGRERGRLLVGSGNLTFTGFGHNHEVYTTLDWTPDDPGLQYIFAQAWELVKSVFRAWGHSHEASTLLTKTERISDWLVSPAEPTQEIQFLQTLDEPLIEQCSRALAGETISRITVLSPFLDDAASALSALYGRFRPLEMRLVVQAQRTIGNVRSLEKLQRDGVPLQVHRFTNDERYLHAKIYIFDAQKASYALTGSANCTRSAWLANASSGNIEITLLRRAPARHFAPLIDDYVSSNAIETLDEIGIRPSQLPVLESEPALIHLLDVSVVGGMLTLIFDLATALEGLTGLQLRFFTFPHRFLDFDDYHTGRNVMQLTIPPELQTTLLGPVPASIWGRGEDRLPVDLRCNELWVTHVDRLRYEIGRHITGDARTGRHLDDMDLGSEEEWRDLYESLVRLIELDVAGLRQRGGTYTSSPPSSPKPRSSATEQEVKIRLVDQFEEPDEETEIAAALFRESPLHAWLEYVYGRLPGAPRVSLESEEEPQEPEPLERGEWRPRRRWTPSEHVSRRFINLVHKYVSSLNNPEYMQAASLYHILAYYAVFQRIVWLLLQHEVIDAERFVRLTREINEGFFGIPGQQPPITGTLHERHILRIWLENWRRAEVQSHALLSVILAEELLNQIGDLELSAQVREQNLRVIAAVATVVGIPPKDEDLESLARIGQAYDHDGVTLAFEITKYVEDRLPDVETTLDAWVRKVTVALGVTDEPRRKEILYQAMQDYALARCNVLERLQKEEARVELCTSMVSWMTYADDSSAIQEWSQRLLDLLEKQGRTQEAAKAMFRQGKELLYEKKYGEATIKLRQALLLAERFGDDKLARQCKSYLGAAELFV
jgi:hypothetical protein